MNGTAPAPAPTMTYALTLEVELLPPVVLTDSRMGRRLFIPIVGGTARGSRLRAEILPGGGDWAVERPDGAMDIHARYMMRANDGVVIEVDNRGHWREAPGGQPYFVTAPVFSVDDARYRWLTHRVFVGMALEVDETHIVIDVYETEMRACSDTEGGS